MFPYCIQNETVKCLLTYSEVRISRPAYAGVYLCDKLLTSILIVGLERKRPSVGMFLV